MKNRITALAFGTLLMACSPKTVVQPTSPKTPETPAVEVASTASESVRKGKILYENNCGKCHRLFSPTEETAENWEPILKRMQKKARLEDADMALIHDYIFANLPK
ncbi:cytochrome c [Flavobacterium selenitireducens]|uniref:cytochrome c n=1 Tax=Flavobacterium selenitireducens TaxID=2722704 RepID=UPI00168AE284|nr:cytochrome c [Flavobacterium selenitireducens]MBD3583930.1 cytochrome c [Flavobacterium selenitireducens]